MMFYSENVMNLWDAWNVRALVILSLLAQVFLTFFAPLRKRVKHVRMLIWLVYLLADWVAELTVGLILRSQFKSPAKSGDIQTFWAPFLLLHLGGPDTITSFALEDNEFWIRHLLGLILQVGSTVYGFSMSLPDNKLWLPTFLVLIASIIKYAERNRAFYLASFDHFGENWVPGERVAGLPIPEQFKKLRTADSVPDDALELHGLGYKDIEPFFVDSDPKSIVQAATYLFGTMRRPLLGSFLSKSQRAKSLANFGSKKKDCFAKDALLKMEIQLSLLYEALHTKLPVIVSKVGCVCRILNLSCILGALLSFSLVKKHYELEEFDAWLTYGLLIGALTLDFISIILLLFSDWFVIANLHILGYFPNLASRLEARFVKRRRWSNKVPQLNFITYSVMDCPNWLKFPPLRSLLEAIRVIRRLSFQNFGEDPQFWHYIFKDVMDVLQNDPEELTRDFFEFETQNGFAQMVLEMNIATELSIHFRESSSGSTSIDGAICKLISNYMFYLMMREPGMMAPEPGIKADMSKNWKKVLKEASSILSQSSICSDRDAMDKILSSQIDWGEDLNILSNIKRLTLHFMDGATSLEELRKKWVLVMCYAARRCRPSVHSQQPSKGGELLTFIWLCMANYTMAKPHGRPTRDGN